MTRQLAFAEEYDLPDRPADMEIRAAAATFFLACLKAGLGDQAAEFAEWYLDEFDHDLET